LQHVTETPEEEAVQTRVGERPSAEAVAFIRATHALNLHAPGWELSGRGHITGAQNNAYGFAASEVTSLYASAAYALDETEKNPLAFAPEAQRPVHELMNAAWVAGPPPMPYPFGLQPAPPQEQASAGSFFGARQAERAGAIYDVADAFDFDSPSATMVA